ncbi:MULTISPECIES: hypothetical protein [Lentzea]|uniref:hypothetical protein n=1 Tax=Lentzea TaxID=165301 RepID=UPI000B7EB55C|nr:MULTISPECIES: hypothetical protein [Lentzea]USX48659.1 hypothetical protein ND450_24625 [Lentzea sp. HUAS12]
MRRSLLLLFVLVSLTGCAYSVQGDPVAAPLPPLAIATPRKTAGVDPCALVTEKDLKPLGTLKFQPVPRTELANSCLFTLNEGSYVMVAVPYRSFEASKKSQTEGREVETSKHATWLSCTRPGAGKDTVCTATIAVTRDESLLVAVGMSGDATESEASRALEPLRQEALKRMPPA